MQLNELLEKVNRIFTTGTKNNITVHRKAKDRLFRFVFSNDKRALLELYNALNHTDYMDAAQLEIVTLEGVLYMSMKNDLAFILAHSMNMYEQQSTFNPNLPLRLLFYISQEYQVQVTKEGMDLYGSALMKLPTPKCVVFYNGAKVVEDDFIMSLSDAFSPQTVDSDLELHVRVININDGHNTDLMSKCKRLSDYSKFVSKIDAGLAQGHGYKFAIEQAITYCIRHDIMADILEVHRSEVLGMLLMEYDERKTMKLLKKAAWKEGLEAGREAGLEEGREEGRSDATYKSMCLMQNTLLNVLRDKAFLSPSLQQQIQEETSLTILSLWMQEAAKAISIADFEERKAAIPEKNEN